MLYLQIDKLTEGNKYLFRVSCENKVGLSLPAMLENPIQVRSQFCKYLISVSSLIRLSYFKYISRY